MGELTRSVGRGLDNGEMDGEGREMGWIKVDGGVNEVGRTGVGQLGDGRGRQGDGLYQKEVDGRDTDVGRTGVG